MLLVKWILKNYMQRDCDQHFSCAPRFLSSSLSSKLLILCCIWNIDHCCPRLESILAVLAQRCHRKKEHVHQHVGQPGCYDSFEGGYIRWSTPCGGQWSHRRQYIYSVAAEPELESWIAAGSSVRWASASSSERTRGRVYRYRPCQLARRCSWASLHSEGKPYNFFPK